MLHVKVFIYIFLIRRYIHTHTECIIITNDDFKLILIKFIAEHKF